jgi:hydroxypyruvate isomerase
MAGELKFCANLKWLFTEVPLEKRYMAAAEAGFKAAEFAWPYDYSISFFRDLLRQSGLQQVLINTPIGKPGTVKASGQACHPDSVKQFREDFYTSLEYAEALNCKMIHLQAGIRQEEVSQELAFSTLVENIRWASEQARAEQVTIVIEAVNSIDIPGFLINTQEQSLSIINLVGADNVKILFDIYHVQRSEGDITTRLRSLFNHIGHVQVADTPGRNEPGTGEINWKFIFGELSKLNYDGWVGCEYRPLSNTFIGLGWMQEAIRGL